MVFPIGDAHGNPYFHPGYDYDFATIIEKSGISRSQLENKRSSGVLWVYKNRPTVSKGEWIIHALQHTSPKTLLRGGMVPKEVLITKGIQNKQNKNKLNKGDDIENRLSA